MFDKQRHSKHILAYLGGVDLIAAPDSQEWGLIQGFIMLHEQMEDEVGHCHQWIKIHDKDKKNTYTVRIFEMHLLQSHILNTKLIGSL